MIEINKIKSIVLNYYGLPKNAFLIKSRKRKYIEPKQVYHYLSKFFNGHILSYEFIAKTTKNNHATVIHSCKTIEDLMSIDKDFKSKIIELKSLCLEYYVEFKGTQGTFKKQKKIIQSRIETSKNKRQLKSRLIIELMKL